MRMNEKNNHMRGEERGGGEERSRERERGGGRREERGREGEIDR